jgi:hypothetical protein
MRRFAAAALLAFALALLVLALVPHAWLHAALSARAGHSVTDSYVSSVKGRAGVCGSVVVLIAVAVLASGRWPIGSPAPSTRTGLLRFARNDRVSEAAFLLALAVIPRAILLLGPPHYDEAFTVTEFASQSPLFFLTRYTHANNHVFHTFLVWFVRLFAGNQMWALRLPAFAAGVAVVAATYLLARRFHGTPAAFCAAAMAAVATPLVEYSAQARGYTILTLAFLLLFLLDDDRLAAVVLALGAWTIPTMLYAGAAWAVWTLLVERNLRRAATVTLLGGGLAFLLYIPILVVSGLDSIIANGNVLPVGYAALAYQLPRSLVETFRQWSLSFTAPLAFVLFGAAAVGVVMRTRSGLLFGSSAGTILVMLLISRRVPFPRVWLFLLPLALIAAASLVPPSTRMRIVATVAAVVAIGVGSHAVWLTRRPDFVEDPAMRDCAAIAAAIGTLSSESRVLITSPMDAPLALYGTERLIIDRFDSDRAAVRAQMLAAPRRFALVTMNTKELDALQLPLVRVETARFEHAVLVELRSPPGTPR